MAESAESGHVYTPHPRYRWMALGSTLLFLLLTWNLLSPLVRSRNLAASDLEWSDLDIGLLFFMAVSLGIALWFGRLALCKVVTTADGVTLSVPLSGQQFVQYRQLVELSESSRSGHAITLLYHPRGRDRLIDPDQIVSLTLPEINHQETLVAEVEGQMSP